MLWNSEKAASGVKFTDVHKHSAALQRVSSPHQHTICEVSTTAFAVRSSTHDASAPAWESSLCLSLPVLDIEKAEGSSPLTTQTNKKKLIKNIPLLTWEQDRTEI